MADYIGEIELDRVVEYDRSGNTVTIEGHMNTRSKLDQLREMFRKCPGNAVVHNVVGGHEIGYDATPGSVLTQYCSFADQSDKARDGWYLLLSMSYGATKLVNHWPFSVQLHFLGAHDFVHKAYDVYNLVEETSDWDF